MPSESGVIVRVLPVFVQGFRSAVTRNWSRFRPAHHARAGTQARPRSASVETPGIRRPQIDRRVAGIKGDMGIAATAWRRSRAD